VTPEDGSDRAASDVAPSARSTPYELVFVEGDFEGRVFPGIATEAAEQGTDPLNPERFNFLSMTGDVLREVTPDDAPPDALEQYRSLLYHAFHFWRSGRRLFVMDRAVARYLVETASPMAGWQFAAPTGSGYLQLPANLFWSSIAPDTPPEPVDGFFYTMSSADEAVGRGFYRLQVLLILGLRRSRAGFSVISLDSGIGPELLDDLSEIRPGGDFANVLPGGEIAGLYSILTTTEALKLVVRSFWYIDRFPETITFVAAADPRLVDDEPPPTRLAYSWFGLQSGEAEAPPEHG
jgi:hypothetical protein